MTLIANYVRRHAIFAMLGTVFFLWLLNFSLSFLGELERLNEGYRFLDALSYIFWRSPQYLYEFLPMATLVGAVVGLGGLANNSELTVMRAAGLSLYRIVFWVMQAAVILVIGALLLNQYILPYSNAKARQIKQADSVKIVSEMRGYWSRDFSNDGKHSRVFHIDYANANGELLDLNLWQLDANNRITQRLVATSGVHLQSNLSKLDLSQSNAQSNTAQTNQTSQSKKHNWALKQVTQIDLHADGTASKQRFAEKTLYLPISPQHIYLMTRPMDDLSITDLYQYNQFLAEQNKVSAEHRLAFWQKLLSPFAFMSLVLIACSFVFGSLRQQSMGLRIVTAILVGLAFRYLQKLLGYMALVYDTSPLFFVMMPIVLSGLVGFYLLNKKR